MTRSVVGRIAVVNQQIDAVYSDLSSTAENFSLTDVLSIEQVNDTLVKVTVNDQADVESVRNFLEATLSASMEEDEYSMVKSSKEFLIGLNVDNILHPEIASLKKEQEDEDGEYDEDDDDSEEENNEDEIEDDEEEDEDSDTVKKIKDKKEKTKEDKEQNQENKLKKPVPDKPKGNEEQKEEKRKVLAVLNTDIGFKMATSLYGMACGKDRSHFPSFVQDLDDFIQDYRRGSGFTGEEEPIQGYQGQRQENSEFIELLEFAFVQNDEMFQDIAKKKEQKFKEGRGGLLSAMMSALSGKAGDSVISSWNSGDVESLMEGLDTAIEKVVAKLVETHPDPKLPPEDDTEEKSE